MGFLWPNISIYVLSYIYIYDPSVRGAAIFAVDVAQNFCTSIGNQFGTYLLDQKRLNPKLVILIGGTLSLAGVLASSFVKRLDYFIVIYGVLTGLGQGTNYMIPMICGWEYFPKHRGRVVGLIMCAFGLSSFFLSLISTAIVNPNDEKAKIHIN